MTSSLSYPFSALVAQPRLRLALLLAAVDWRLSVLLKGDKGSGQSTAARSLAELLPNAAPFVNLPLGATEDRLLGSLDLAQALEGTARLKHGLIHAAHGGVLYIDEVNLLPDALADALLDVSAGGHHHVERDGFSTSFETQFVLLGSMNAEEGSLRPQLLDRFALALDVAAPSAIEERVAIVETRLRFDADPAAFRADFAQQQEQLRENITQARTRTVHYSRDTLHALSSAIANLGVPSLRADLAALRAAMAHAALHQRSEVQQEDIDAVLPLVLHHRARSSPPPRSQPPSPPQNESSPKENRAAEHIFPLDSRTAPELQIKSQTVAAQRGRTAEAATSNSRLDPVASLTQAFRSTGAARFESDHLVFRHPPQHSGVRFIFVVDASGSHAAQQRMRAVKTAVAGLLQSSVDAKDEVAVVAFRGPQAQIALAPCRDAESARRVLECLPTGGRTPLAHALQLTLTLITPGTLVILVTDGRANVALDGGEPWQEALDIARTFTCPSVVVNSSVDNANSVAALASAMKTTLIGLDELNSQTLLLVLSA